MGRGRFECYRACSDPPLARGVAPTVSRRHHEEVMGLASHPGSADPDCHIEHADNRAVWGRRVGCSMGMLRARSAESSFRAGGYRVSHHELQLKPGNSDLKGHPCRGVTLNFGDNADSHAHTRHAGRCYLPTQTSARPSNLWQVTKAAPTCHQVTSSQSAPHVQRVDEANPKVQHFLSAQTRGSLNLINLS